MTRTELERACARAGEGARIDEAEALLLLRHAPLPTLAELATRARERLRPGAWASYIVNTNVNYTNVCVTRCGFCSFYRPPGHPEGYLLEHEEVLRRVREAQARGATQVLLQGGHHPRLRLEWLLELLRRLRAETGVWVHALSAPEVAHLARVEKQPLERVLVRLREAGLQTLPGGGAELLDDEVRRAISPLKLETAGWLRVHEAAHRLGIRSSATLMFGTAHDRDEHIVRHLGRLRALQDRTGGFTAFIAWTYQQGPAPIPARAVEAAEYLRVLALARVFLDDVAVVQASPLTRGPSLAGLALEHGADDLGNVLLEEHVVASAGCQATLDEARARALIREAGLEPRRRDTLYRLEEPGRGEPVREDGGVARRLPVAS